MMKTKERMTAADKAYFAQMREEQATPAREAGKTFALGMALTLVYTAITYGLQASINKMLDDFNS